MIAALALVVGLALPAVQDPLPGTVRGTIRSAGDGTPLAGATAAMWAADAVRPAHTDSTGSYLLRAVPPGRRVIRAWRPDHEPLEVEVEVPAGGEVMLDLSLRPRVIPLAGIRVRAEALPGASGGGEADGTPAPSAALQVTGMKSLESTPGIAELGLGGDPRGTPGQAPPDPSGVLYVRGSAAELKLVLLDGAPVYTPFHLGGVLESFEAEALGAARLYLGGAPARYGGGLAYVLDLSTRPGRGEGVRSTGSLDLLSTRITAEGAVAGRVRYLLAGRALHQWGFAPLAGDPLPYGYGDAVARVDVELGRESALSLTGFHNREAARLDTLPAGRDRVEWG
ncbi:MAG TPA: TonB-dependent receptor, partial [Longimicrobiaceae bacterium]|nr:TonB-dependent receptor [Longimicrobiaceae bacterium]